MRIFMHVVPMNLNGEKRQNFCSRFYKIPISKIPYKVVCVLL